MKDPTFAGCTGHLTYKTEVYQITFYELENDNVSSKPSIKYSLIIFDDMTFKIWYGGNLIPSDTIPHIVKSNKISLLNEIIEIMDYLKKLNNSNPSIPDEVNTCVQRLRKLEGEVDTVIRSKLQFIIEQLQLAFMHIKHRRYSPDLLSTCVLWENTSSNLYIQIRGEGLLTIPSIRYIKKLTSAISVETGLTEQTIKYLEARFLRLADREKIGSLIFDEIYVAKRCEFSRSNGQIYGINNGEPTKTLLTVMFKSIVSKYEDVIAMVPLIKIDSSVLLQLFTDGMHSITSVGYDVVVSLVDGHSSNVKFYKKELCADKPDLFIPHSVVESKRLYLLYDATHVFKCVYNNFQKRVVFECPNFGDMCISPNFHHIVELYNMELSKPVKKAFELNDECLNPQAIEKTKVGLSARVFGESTRNALTYYVKNGHPEWSGTLNFLNVIGKWWNLLNIKSLSKGKRKRDINMETIDATNIERFLAFMDMFATWLDDWMS